MITAEIFMNALMEGRVVIVSKNNKGTLYHVYIIENNQLHPVLGIGGLWSESKWGYYCTVIGMYRPARVIESIAKGLGIEEVPSHHVIVL